ncbi:MAG: hypothetical protein WBA25_03355 [Jannaschia sp.]
MRAHAPLMALVALLAPAACVTQTPSLSVSGGDDVSPGLASCLGAIGRPDVAADPEADMSETEIEALLGCTAERASQ